MIMGSPLLWVLNGMYAIFYRVLARASKGGAITDGLDHVDLPIKLLLWRGLVAGVGGWHLHQLALLYQAFHDFEPRYERLGILVVVLMIPAEDTHIC